MLRCWSESNDNLAKQKEEKPWIAVIIVCRIIILTFSSTAGKIGLTCKYDLFNKEKIIHM